MFQKHGTGKGRILLNRNFRKTIAMLLACTYITAQSAVFANETNKEDNNTYGALTENVYSAEYELSDGLTYKRTIGYHDTYGLQREYVLEYEPGSETKMTFAAGEYLYSRNTIRNMAAYELPEENYIAGINADFFNMSTGVPASAFIRDSELYTSDRDSYCLAEREDGIFFIDKPQIWLTLTDENGTEYNILDLNKEFTVYGLYLYNDRYSTNTHINSSNTSVVLYPYEDRLRGEELVEKLIEEDMADDTLLEMIDEYSIIDPYSQSGEELKQEIIDYVGTLTEYEKIGEYYYLITDVFPSIGETQKLVAASVNSNAGNEEIPENSYVLSADNSSYGYILMQFAPGNVFELKIDGNEKFYDVVNAIGTGAVIVSESQVIDDRTFSHYLSNQPRSAVGIKEDGSLVFFAVDGRQTGFSSGMKLLDLAQRMKELGCVYAANFDGGGSTAVNASLPGFDLADTVNSPSDKSERKVSNAVIFTNSLEKDGIAAQAYAYSDYYLTLNDYHISLGEIIPADANGFSAEWSTDADETTASENNENNSEDTQVSGQAQGNENNPQQETDPDSGVQDEKTQTVESQVTDENNTAELSEEKSGTEEPDGEKADEETEETEIKDEEKLPENLSLYTKDGKGFVADGELYPAGFTGNIEVYASLDGGVTENIAANVVSIENPDKVVISTEKTVIAPFESAELSVAAFYRNLNVSSGIESYEWTVSLVEPEEENASDSPENGEEQQQDQPASQEGLTEPEDIQPDETENTEEAQEPEISAGIIENGIFTPSLAGVDVEIKAARGDVEGVLKLTVDSYPFVDMAGHWAVKEIYSLAKQGIVKGEYGPDGEAYYLPQRNFSRYEFCVMLARMTNIGEDLPVPEYPGTENTEQNQEQEQASADNSVPENNAEQESTDDEYVTLDFADADNIPEWAYEAVFRLYATGILQEIMRTDENGNTYFAGSEYITRAEVADVIGRICDPAPDDYVMPEYMDIDEQSRYDYSLRNTLYAGIFNGYEDMSLRLRNNLTRAEAAAVFVRLADYLEGLD